MKRGSGGRWRILGGLSFGPCRRWCRCLGDPTPFTRFWSTAALEVLTRSGRDCPGPCRAFRACHANVPEIIHTSGSRGAPCIEACGSTSVSLQLPIRHAFAKPFAALRPLLGTCTYPRCKRSHSASRAVRDHLACGFGTQVSGVGRLLGVGAGNQGRVADIGPIVMR